MANESPLIHDGSQTVSVADYRNSTQTGTTRMGPNGSGQFLAVQLSTAVDRTVGLTTAAGANAYGILQNKPYTGDAADVAIFGVCKAVVGSTFASGVPLMADTSGCMIPYTTSANQRRVGISIESGGTVGAVFTMFLNPAGGYF